MYVAFWTERIYTSDKVKFARTNKMEKVLNKSTYEYTCPSRNLN
jgi:hypothetical protein